MNTFNICLGHEPFPEGYAHYYDLMISPRLISGSNKLAIIRDEDNGVNGHALSEYNQLFWIYDNLDSLASGYEFLHIFHYRRFTSPILLSGTPGINNPWITVVKKSNLPDYAFNFEREKSKELFNQPVHFQGGMISQFAITHVLKDLLNFSNYLVERNIFTQTLAAEFLTQQNLIAANNIGVFRVETFRKIFAILKNSAGFMDSEYYVPREGYQRRVMGYLLERVTSFILYKFIESGEIEANFGHHMYISEQAETSTTNYDPINH